MIVKASKKYQSQHQKEKDYQIWKLKQLKVNKIFTNKNNKMRKKMEEPKRSKKKLHWNNFKKKIRKKE